MNTAPSLIVLPHEQIGLINPFLHGHFAEHLGEMIYPGVWVGEDSPIPNEKGIRKDILEALKPLRIPVLRWPGGCFADDYHWRDGIGAARPKRVNVHWGMAEEPNTFGTHEFMAFCRTLGAEPYFAANLGSGTPGEMRQWIEYCNFAGSSALADERRSNGDSDPFSVRYWGIGNENWGCGGSMSPEEYAAAYARFRSFAKSYPGTKVEGIACGPNGFDWRWTQKFFENLGDRIGMVQGFAAHYYCGAAGTATEYDNDQWMELLVRAAAVEGIITGHRAIMDVFDPERKIKMLLDEWGTWHPVEIGKPSGGLYQQNTIRDACVAALSLDIFNNHADKLFMANIAQLINVLQALLLVEDDKCIKTPTFHVFDLYRPHQGAQAVRVVNDSVTLSDGGLSKEHIRSCYRDRQPLPLHVVQGSASLKGNALCVTLVNSHPTETQDVEIEVRGSLSENWESVTLAADNIRAHNTFDQPERVKLDSPVNVQAKGSSILLRMAPGSITRLSGNVG